MRGRPTPSPIVRVLNQDVGRYHRWCTPSILRGPGARRGLLRLRRVDLRGVLRHARRPHGGLRRGRALRRRTRRAPTARCSPCTARAARTGSCCGCSRWSARTRSCSSRATIHHSVINALKAFGLDFRFLPDAVRAALRGAAAAERRAGRRGPAARARGARGPLHVADVRGADARTRAGSSTRVHARLADRDGDRRRGLGRAPALPSRRCPSRRWRRAPTSACSRRTSSPAGCSRRA